MKIIYILCEGQTEEAFINEILSPYFAKIDICTKPIICSTKRTNAKKYKGGISNYTKIKNELTILCKEHKKEKITTMFDYYAMPNNTPNINCTEIDLYKRMELIEKAITDDIGQPNCFFNLMLHEFEGLLFSSPNAFAKISDEHIVAKIRKIREEVPSPEHINNSPDTAPSKRLKSIMPNYAKIKNGIMISKYIGIDKLLEECKHFKKWVDKMKNC